MLSLQTPRLARVKTIFLSSCGNIHFILCRLSLLRYWCYSPLENPLMQLQEAELVKPPEILLVQWMLCRVDFDSAQHNQPSLSPHLRLSNFGEENPRQMDSSLALLGIPMLGTFERLSFLWKNLHTSSPYPWKWQLIPTCSALRWKLSAENHRSREKKEIVT